MDESFDAGYHDIRAPVAADQPLGVNRDTATDGVTKLSPPQRPTSNNRKLMAGGAAILGLVLIVVILVLRSDDSGPTTSGHAYACSALHEAWGKIGMGADEYVDYDFTANAVTNGAKASEDEDFIVEARAWRTGYDEDGWNASLSLEDMGPLLKRCERHFPGYDFA